MDQFLHSDSHNKPTTHPQKHHQPSNSELLASAKLLAEAAQSSMRHETGKVDKGRAAGAAADLLDAASHYGKLEEKSFGKYVEKAETYLHQYHSSHSSTTTTTHGSGHSAATTTHSSATTTHSAPHSAPHSDGDDAPSSGSGYGEYFKMAEGFLKKY
ncbi:hypothetical protein FH972_008902 [Carpinus fangiana]|uniref:Uncharacterized protein n=1 Tax=Carpinus fangiana TaxID=176857 RepID=A0A5N6R083_9ROSI|nr:hypothetical protein FH972_008902 [Carpinus fangiana]